MNSNSEFWTSSKLRKKYPNANIYFVFGARSKGKSFDSKSLTVSTALDKLGTNHGRVALIRRFKEECTAPKIRFYYNNLKIWDADNTLSDYTGGQYDCIVPNESTLYFGKAGKKDPAAVLGYYIPLEREQDFAGAAYEDVDNMVMEEAISRTRYIIKEPTHLMNLYCTINRNRKGPESCKLWMFGNLVGQYIPYVSEWGLRKFIKNMEPGTMKSVYIPRPIKGEYPHGTETVAKIPPAYRGDYLQCIIDFTDGNDELALVGEDADTLATGKWQRDNKPKLTDNFKRYKLLYRMVVDLDDSLFLAEYRALNHERFWFVYPKTDKRIHDRTRVISDQIHPSIRYTVGFQARNQTETKLFREFNVSNVFFSDDDTGTLFSQLALNFLGIKI